MLSLRIASELELRLQNLADKTGRTKSFYVKAAIKQYLEDKEDYLLALASLENSKERYTLEEVAKKLDLEG